MRITPIKSAVLGLCLATALPAQARDFDSSNYLTLLVGYHFFDHERQIEDDPSLAIGLGHEFNRHWAMEILYGGAKLEPDPDDFRDITARFVRLDALYHFEPEVWRPYVVIGASHFETELNNVDEEDTHYNLGLGLKHEISESMDLRFDARGVYGEQDETKDTVLNLGLTVLFEGLVVPPEDSDGDGVFDDEDQCPNTPYGAEVDASGCEIKKDSDGDGVLDEDDLCPNTPAGTEVNDDGCPREDETRDDDEDGVPNTLDQCPDTPLGAKIDAETGCRLKLTETVSIRLAVNFPLNSAEIPDLEMVEVEKLARFLTEYPDTQVVVEGHSDSTGDATYNQQLSQKRAEAVKEAVIQRYGIAAERVSAIGYGEERPIADNSTATGRQMNRRVVGVVEATVEKNVE